MWKFYPEFHECWNQCYWKHCRSTSFNPLSCHRFEFPPWLSKIVCMHLSRHGMMWWQTPYVDICTAQYWMKGQTSAQRYSKYSWLVRLGVDWMCLSDFSAGTHWTWEKHDKANSNSHITQRNSTFICKDSIQSFSPFKQRATQWNHNVHMECADALNMMYVFAGLIKAKQPCNCEGV